MFAPDIIEAIRQHAMADFPNESCGVVLARPDHGKDHPSCYYQKLDNISTEPEKAFECTEQLAPFLVAETVLALVHSHPNGPDSPTYYDIQQAIVMDIPWGIVACTGTATLQPFFWHDDFEPPPLVGRQFRYGPSGTDGRGDCGALVHDYYRRERGIRLPEFPRESRCWLAPDFSYRQNLITAGFVQIPGNQLEIGDVFLATFKANVANHSGIFIGNERILHHLENRLSREDTLVGWSRLITGWYRYAGA